MDLPFFVAVFRFWTGSCFFFLVGLRQHYDMLDWSYIKACLLKFGFHERQISLIMDCISSVSYSININGSTKCFFKPFRGIRQGDPLSPYLFIICMEPFSRHFNFLANNTRNQVGLLSSPWGFRISNLVFADDCLIFSKASSTTARKISSDLQIFSQVSGLQINFNKSTLFFFS